MKRILIVEDEVAIAADLQDIIEDSGYECVGIAFTHDSALEQIKTKLPDLVFLDISLMGKGSGLDVAKVLRTEYEIPYIFLTSYSDPMTISQVVNLEPMGYLIKPFKEDDIAPTIALAFALAQKKKNPSFPELETLEKKLKISLTKQEYKILNLIWQNNRNIEIANQLSVSINTVKTHIQNVYLKLGVNSRAGAIKKVMV